MKNKTTQEQLIELYEQQIQDLVMMSKIELGDDVIAKIKELKSQIHKQQSVVEWLEQVYDSCPAYEESILPDEFEQAKAMFKQQMIEFGYACTKQIEMNEAGELLMVKSPEELYTQVYGGEMSNNNPGTTTDNPTVRDLIKSYINDVEAFGEELSDVEIDTLYDFALYVDEIDIKS
jgi:hypothetical protein